MANNKINSQDLVNDLDKAVDEAKKIVKETKKIVDLFEEVAGYTKENAENLEKTFKLINKNSSKGILDLNKALEDTNELLEDNEKLLEEKLKAEKKLAKQEKELIKLTEKLNDKLKDGSVESEKLKVQIQERNKASKEAAKDALGLIDAYTKESKALLKMKKDLKNTTIEMRRMGKSEEEVEKATKGAREEISKLDRELRDLDKSVADSYREIGKYEEALESLGETAGGLPDFLTGAAVGLLAGAATGAVEFNREIDKTAEKIGNISKAAALSGVSSVIETLLGTDEATKALSVAAAASVTANDEASESRSKLNDEEERWNDLLKKRGNLGPGESSDAITEEINNQKTLVVNLVKLNDLAKENAKVKKQEFISIRTLGEENKENSRDTLDAIEVLNKFTDEKIDASIANGELERSLSKVMKTQAELSIISEDDTRSFKERNVASLALIETNKLVAATQVKIAKSELELQTLNASAQLVAAGRLTKEKALTLTGEELNEMLKVRANAFALSEAAAESFNGAYIGFQGAQTEASTTRLDAEEKRGKFLSDLLERDLDILIDGADRVKSINERVIADEGVSDKRRRQILIDTQDLMKKSFDAQVKTIEEFGIKRIDLNSKLSISEKKTLKENVSAAKIKSLLEAKDAVELNEKIRLLGLSEIFEGRTLQAILERIQAQQDLLEDRKELNKSDLESLEIGEDIIKQEKLLAILRNNELDTQEELDAALEGLEDERVQNRINAIDEELKAVEKGSLEAKRLNQEKNDLLIEQDQKAADKRIKIEEDRVTRSKKIATDYLAWVKAGREKAKEARRELIEGGIDLLDEILTRSREKRENALDEELDGLDSRIDTVRDAIQSGNSEASESLAELEKQKAEAKAKQAKLRQREIRDEKLIAGLRLLAGNDGDVGKTLGDIALLIASLDQVSGSFFDGTENTGTVANPLDSNGGRMAMLHDNERVVTAKQNARIGGMSNDDLADLAQMHNSGNLGGGSTTVIQNNNRELVGKMDEVAKAIKNIPTSSYNYDATSQFHEQVLVTANKKEIIKKRASNLFK